MGWPTLAEVEVDAAFVTVNAGTPAPMNVGSFFSFRS